MLVSDHRFKVVTTKQKKNWSQYFSKREGKIIAPDKLKKIPYNSIGKLFIHEGNGAHQFGSAFKVAPNILMTAAHCLAKIIEERIYYFDDVTYSPVFPHLGYYTATQLVIPDAYIKNKHTQHDYGFIIFDAEIPGDILLIETQPQESGRCCSIGYPDSYNYYGDKMIEAKGQYEKPYEEKMIIMSGIDMRSGCSGGPILDDCTHKIISLNSGNIGGLDKKQMSGPIMREEIAAELQSITNSLRQFA